MLDTSPFRSRDQKCRPIVHMHHWRNELHEVRHAHGVFSAAYDHDKETAAGVVSVQWRVRVPESKSCTITGLSYSMQSKGHTRLDDGRKGESLLDGCRAFAWKFLFQTLQRDHEQAEEALSTYVVVR
ncbi:hypothetical protein TNCV_731431 [Trichonephila clavipes]|nr:hypothetical protein TNCV_731431 [Trichonephila clavipes]